MISSFCSGHWKSVRGLFKQKYFWFLSTDSSCQIKSISWNNSVRLWEASIANLFDLFIIGFKMFGYPWHLTSGTKVEYNTDVVGAMILVLCKPHLGTQLWRYSSQCIRSGMFSMCCWSFLRWIEIMQHWWIIWRFSLLRKAVRELEVPLICSITKSKLLKRACHLANLWSPEFFSYLWRTLFMAATSVLKMNFL